MSKKRRKNKKNNQNHVSTHSFFSMRFPLWMAPIFGAVIALALCMGITVMVVEEIPMEVFIISVCLGALAGGVLWIRKR